MPGHNPSLGPFEIRGELGRGAKAMVWRGYDPALDREVAIKEPRLPEGGDDAFRAEFAERFVREARAAARLNHPRIVTIHAAGVYDDRPVIVMELIEGWTLRDVLAKGALTPAQTYTLMDQLLDAVAYAHERDVTHRDLKPDNVFVNRDGAVKLADFGIAQVGQAGPPLTCPGTMLGTPAYMAPEQIRGEEVDVRCDVFALGVIAFECLTAENPFGSGTSTHYATIVHRIINEPAPPVRATGAAVGPLAGVIKAAMMKDRARRFRNAAAMRAAWRASFTAPADAKTALGGRLLGSAGGPRTTSVPRMPESTLVWGASLRRRQEASHAAEPASRPRDPISLGASAHGSAAPASNPAQCPVCGEKLADGVRFCRNCGRLVRRSGRGRS